MYSQPWDLNADLQKYRLLQLAHFIAAVRSEVIDLYDESLGDTRLSLGMRAYECCRSRILRAADSGEFPYLSILTPEGRFTFQIGGTPVRFSRNDPDHLPDRKIVVSEAAMNQMKLFGDTDQNSTIRWFFVFDTDFKSAADSVYFVGYSETGDIVCQWEIPLEDSVTHITDTKDNLSQPVDLPKPAVGIKKVVPDNDKEKDGS